jgi:hypothetical protein
LRLPIFCDGSGAFPSLYRPVALGEGGEVGKPLFGDRALATARSRLAAAPTRHTTPLCSLSAPCFPRKATMARLNL